MSAPQINISVNKRVPLDISIAEMGVDYTDAAVVCEIRQNPGDTGTPLISLTNASPPAQGMSIEYRPDYEDPEGELPPGASFVRMAISEATLEALPYASDPQKPLILHYDIQITPIVGVKFVFCGGTFQVNPGVTL